MVCVLLIREVEQVIWLDFLLLICLQEERKLNEVEQHLAAVGSSVGVLHLLYLSDISQL